MLKYYLSVFLITLRCTDQPRDQQTPTQPLANSYTHKQYESTVTMCRHQSVHNVCAPDIWNEMKLSPEHVTDTNMSDLKKKKKKHTVEQA